MLGSPDHAGVDYDPVALPFCGAAASSIESRRRSCGVAFAVGMHKCSEFPKAALDFLPFLLVQ